jgi:hypothetical protein
MGLNELYKRGSKLIREDGSTDVPPDFHGMSVKEWNRIRLDQDFADPAGIIPNGAPGTKWRGKAIATPRDNYGMKGTGV